MVIADYTGRRGKHYWETCEYRPPHFPYKTLSLEALQQLHNMPTPSETPVQEQLSIESIRAHHSFKCHLLGKLLED